MEKEKQIIEVEFNQNIVDKDLQIQKENIEEKLIQDTFNEDGMNELLEEGEVENEYKNN